MKPFLPLAFCFFSLDSISQSINSSTVNSEGGTVESGYYQVDWSIGEGASIATFQDQSNLVLTTGVLQPYTVKTEIVNFLSSTLA